MAQGEVVIIGKDGTEHVFPPGFDPKKAAAIVRGQATAAPVAPAAAPESPMQSFQRQSSAGMRRMVEGVGQTGKAWFEGGPQRMAEGAATMARGVAGAPGGDVMGGAGDVVAGGVTAASPALIYGAASGAAGIAGSVASGAATVAQGAKAAAKFAAPTVQYEAVWTALRAVGVPEPAATIAAQATAATLGWRRGGGKAAASTVTPKAPQPPASRTGTQWEPGAMPTPMSRPAPAGAPVAPVAKSAMSPQRIQNELGLAARRAGLKLSETQYEQAAGLVGAGRSPLEAVRAVAPGPIAVPKGKLTAAQTKEYLRLRSAGKSDAEAKAALDAVQALASKLGGPTPEQARAAVQVRNATGRWQ